MKRTNFDRIVFIYDFLANLVFGKSIRKSQISFLKEITSDQSVLIMGGGTGWILEEIAKHASPQITYIDSSANMIKRSRRRSYPWRRIQFIEGTQEDIPKGKQFDVIITFYFLDLFEEETLKSVMKQLNGQLANNGLWLFADFNPDIQQEKNVLKKTLLRILFWFFKTTCKIQASRLGDFKNLFKEQGLVQLGESFFYSKMIVSRFFRKSST